MCVSKMQFSCFGQIAPKKEAQRRRESEIKKIKAGNFSEGLLFHVNEAIIASIVIPNASRADALMCKCGMKSRKKITFPWPSPPSSSLCRYRCNETWHKFPKRKSFSFFVDFIQLRQRTKRFFLALADECGRQKTEMSVGIRLKCCCEMVH